MDLFKSIISALFCAIVIAIGSLFGIAPFTPIDWSAFGGAQQMLWFAGVIGWAIGLSGLIALGYIKALWVSVGGFILWSTVILWFVVVNLSSDYVGAFALMGGAGIVICLLFSAASYAVIRWNNVNENGSISVQQLQSEGAL